jgi:hypothetical protein
MTITYNRFGNVKLVRVVIKSQSILMKTQLFLFFSRMIQNRGAQIPGARSSWWPNFVRWHLTFVGPQYGTCFMSPFWHLEFWCDSWSRSILTVEERLAIVSAWLCILSHGKVHELTQEFLKMVPTRANTQTLVTFQRKRCVTDEKHSGRPILSYSASNQADS